VSGADVPMPYSKPLEEIAFPHEPQIIQATLAAVDKRVTATPGAR
jgi:pyruvate/2-oxoglutarate/acetoin dehydrogenase E1 component